MTAKVYFSKEITPEKVVELYRALGVELPGRVADDVRLFLEEVELPPHFVKDVGLSAFTADELKGLIARAYLQ